MPTASQIFGSSYLCDQLSQSRHIITGRVYAGIRLLPVCRPTRRDQLNGNIHREIMESGSTAQYTLGSAEGGTGAPDSAGSASCPPTERLFREAGIGPSQHVLDLGSGVGDVAMLAARLVGPQGEVVGVEQRRAIASAGQGLCG
jgi:Protein-L-isoaspartate(D-aspartate) O-methyltransferase (PCMT)